MRVIAWYIVANSSLRGLSGLGAFLGLSVIIKVPIHGLGVLGGCVGNIYRRRDRGNTMLVPYGAYRSALFLPARRARFT